jgi:hypothetical protein
MSFNQTRQFQGYQGPTDPFLKSSEIEGYQPVSRIGEVVISKPSLWTWNQHSLPLTPNNLPPSRRLTSCIFPTFGRCIH